MDVSIQELMRTGINEAQRAVTQAAPGSGTTLTAALILGQQVTIGHVGDSRAYAIHSYGGGETLTRDHRWSNVLKSLVKFLLKRPAHSPSTECSIPRTGPG